MDSRLSLLPLLFLLCCAPAGAATLPEQRQAFLVAEQALEQGDMEAFNRFKQDLRDYPLYPYLEHVELERELASDSRARVDAFLAAYADTPLAWQLRGRWLDLLAKEKNWQLYRSYYQPTGNTRRQCLQLQALIHTGERDEAFSQVAGLWLHGRSQPDTCDPVFDAWRVAGGLTTELAWQRIELAIGKGQTQLARYLERYLPEAERPWAQLWRRLHRQPGKVLQEPLLKTLHPYREKILLHAIRRQTQMDVLAAMPLWQQLKARYSFDTLTTHTVDRRMALYLTRKEEPKAYAFVQQIEPCTHDTRLQETKIRAALYREDWKAVLASLKRLPAEYRESERWRYWRARALLELDEADEAEALLLQLSRERSFYGFLAADRINHSYAFDHQDTPLSEAGRLELLAMPGILRARELFMLERSIPAIREWREATAGMSRGQLMAAATLAESWAWHDQAIFTLARTGYWDDLELRFPIDHQPLVQEHAEEQELTTAFIYAVIRQESAFRTDALSPAGARGLMQLMPATARNVAKKRRGGKGPSISELKQPETNIALGSAYLREVLDKWENNPVLATASYNAGPHRVTRWLPPQRLDADIWVELIPYRETRGYVQRVLTYQVIYEKRLGQEPVRISKRMAPIKSAEAYALEKRRRAGPS